MHKAGEQRDREDIYLACWSFDRQKLAAGRQPQIERQRQAKTYVLRISK